MGTTGAEVMCDFIPLTAGPLSMLFDRERAFLRCVRYGEREIVRGVFAAIRDRDWNTIPFTVHELQIEQTQAAFSLVFLAKCSQDGIEFDWRGILTGSPDGVVCFRFDGEARTAFLKNRIGLCVLHPIRECAGQSCRVEHVDGSVTVGQFPQQISPHQPFKNIRSITHFVQEGVEARVTFDGEVFEMEDQRNWTDASFKTYSTPLELPFPVVIAAGSTIHHAATMELLGPASARRPQGASDAETRVTLDWAASRPLPPIGFLMASESEPPSRRALDRLREVQPAHVRIDLRLEDDAWREPARKALERARQVGCQLEVALFTRDFSEAHWRACREFFRPHLSQIARWLVFHPTAKATPAELVETAGSVLAEFDPSLPVVVGTDAYFAELNRNRPPVRPGMSVCYSLNPQVHAFDHLSLSETLEAQASTVDSAAEVFGCDVVVSPITLRPRFNPNATSVEKDALTEPEADPRQPTGFAAAWTAATIGALATHPRLASLTFYEPFGSRGIMDHRGNPYPMYEVFQSLRGMKTISAGTSSRPLELRALGLADDNGRRSILLANLSKIPLVVMTEMGPEGIQEIEVKAESVHILTAEDLA